MKRPEFPRLKPWRWKWADPPPYWLRFLVPLRLLFWISENYQVCWPALSLWKYGQWDDAEDAWKWSTNAGCDANENTRWTCWCGKYRGGETTVHGIKKGAGA